MISTYSELKTAIANFYDRNDLTSRIDEFIDLCESEMQRKLKTLDFETVSTVTVTGGIGTLPTGFSSARSFTWNSNPTRSLTYVTPDRLSTINSRSPGTVSYYTIVGNQIKFADDQDGTVDIDCTVKFTPLSDSNTTNPIITDHPSAYLYGSMIHAAVFCKDSEGATSYKALFEEQIASINSNNAEKKFAGPLMVRPG